MEPTENKDSFLDKIFHKKWTPFLIIAGIGFVLYFQAFFFNFSYLDDNNLILDNQYFLSHFLNIFSSFLTDVFHLFNSSAFYYRPILTISLILDYQVGNIHPFIYHFTNVMLHIVSSYLVFVLLVKLNYKKTLSFLFSILFLVHPVLTQAIAWIPGRNDSLLAVFVLATFIFFIKYLREEKRSNLIWSLIFLGLTLFTKESGIFIILILFFYLYFIYKEKRLSFNSYYFFIGSAGILGLWTLLRHITLVGSHPIGFLGMVKSIFVNSPAVIQFVGKIFFPFNLNVLPVLQDTTFIYGIIALVILLLLVIFTKQKRWSFLLLGIGWFFAFLLPSFIRPNTSLVADFIEHRLYVPIIGLFIVLLETDLIKRIDLKKKSVLAIVGCIIILFSVITVVHSRNFVNRLAFWKNAAQNSPHYPLAHRNLGAMEYLDGDTSDAEKEFKIALELNPEEQMAHNNLGLIYSDQGKFKESEDEYKKELEVNPYYDNAYFNLGLLYWNQKMNDKAVESWKKTLEINPNNIDALKVLMIYYYNNKDYTNAIPYISSLYQIGVPLSPELIRLLQLSSI